MKNCIHCENPSALAKNKYPRTDKKYETCEIPFCKFHCRNCFFWEECFEDHDDEKRAGHEDREQIEDLVGESMEDIGLTEHFEE